MKGNKYKHREVFTAINRSLMYLCAREHAQTQWGSNDVRGLIQHFQSKGPPAMRRHLSNTQMQTP
eukprot:5470623-Prorocentrum_lima.AAC.1